MVANPIGLACVPSAIPAAERAKHFLLARELLGQALERQDLDDGFAFSFEADRLLDLARFMDNERKCCPFMRFALEISPEAAPIWLQMTGPEGTREVLLAELSLSGRRVDDDWGKVRWATGGALIASLGICAATCLLPAALVGLGVAVPFVRTLDWLASYEWAFVAITAVLLAYGFYTVYVKPTALCADGAACTARERQRFLKIVLWLGAALALGGIAYGFIEPWLTR